MIVEYDYVTNGKSLPSTRLYDVCCKQESRIYSSSSCVAIGAPARVAGLWFAAQEDHESIVRLLRDLRADDVDLAMYMAVCAACKD